MLTCLAVTFIVIGCIIYLINYVKETFKSFWPKRKSKEVVENVEVTPEDIINETEENKTEETETESK